MFKRASHFIVTVMCATVFVGVAAYAAAGFHNVKFDVPVVDVGSVREGQQVRARFQFRNHGPTAAILDVEPSCGVVASLLRRGTVAPGEDGEVEVRIDTSGRQGLLTSVVAVRLTDPLERTVLLTVKAIVDREFVVGSPIVHFGKISRQASAQRELQRELRIGLNRTEHRVLSARSTDDNFDAYVDWHRSDGVANIVVIMRRQTEPGLKFGTIRIATSSPHMPQLIVPVRAMVTNPS